MKCTRWKAGPLAMACLGMLLPVPALEGAPSAPSVPASQLLVADVELGTAGVLQGVVVDAQDIPIADAPVTVFRDQQEAARAATDPQGRFAIRGLAGGSYRVVVGGSTHLLRAWAANTAPPGASQGLRIRISDVVRGQQPLREFLTSDPIIIGALVAAMIAVPIVVHNANHRPSSP